MKYDCKVHDECEGAGTPKHIQIVLRAKSLQSILITLGDCCGRPGSDISGAKSCMCNHLGQEIGRRAGMIQIIKEKEHETVLCAKCYFVFYNTCKNCPACSHYRAGNCKVLSKDYCRYCR